jgi:uncharacterized protein
MAENHYIESMSLKKEIQRRNAAFQELCHTHNVKYLYAFGSSLTNKFDKNTSDIDFLVEIEAEDPLERGEKLLSLWEKLEVFFGRNIDLLTESSLKNPVLKKNIDSTKVLIYDGKGQKILI